MRLFFACLLCLAICFPVMAQEDGKDIEEMILANADKNIEKYRKSDASIELVVLLQDENVTFFAK